MYFLEKYSFISIALSCAKLSLEWTVACFLSGVKTIFSSFTPNDDKSCFTCSVVNSVFDAISIRVPLEKSIPKLSLNIPNEIVPAIIIAILNAKNFFIFFVKLNHSNFVFNFNELIPNLDSWIDFLLTPKYSGLLLKILEFTNKLNSNLVPNTEVIKLTRIDSNNIVAKPLTLLVPKINSTIAAITVVNWESKIVQSDWRAPSRYAFLSGYPARTSSLILSYIIILASTAIPTPRIKAAIPGNVRTPEIMLKNTTVI